MKINKMEYSRKIVPQHQNRRFWNMEYSRNIQKIQGHNEISFFLEYRIFRSIKKKLLSQQKNTKNFEYEIFKKNSTTTKV